MASMWYLVNTWHYWILSVYVICTIHVCAVEQYCVRDGSDENRRCTVNCSLHPPPELELPKFLDLKKCPNVTLDAPCLADNVTTTEQPTSSFTQSTEEQTSSPGTGISSTPTPVTYDTTLVNTQSTPSTTEVDSSTTEVDSLTMSGDTTATHEPISSTILGSSATLSSGYISSTSDESYNSTIGENGTSQPPPKPTSPDDTGTLASWVIVLIVVLVVVMLVVVLVIAYIMVRKKNIASCKVHCDGDSGSDDKDLESLPHQGKSTVQKYHERGSLILVPVVDPINHPSSLASPAPAPRPASAEEPKSYSPVPTGGPVTQTENDSDSRNRALSTGSQAGDTSLLIQDGKATSPPATKKTKTKNNRKDIEMTPVESKDETVNPTSNADE